MAKLKFLGDDWIERKFKLWYGVEQRDSVTA